MHTNMQSQNMYIQLYIENIYTKQGYYQHFLVKNHAQKHAESKTCIHKTGMHSQTCIQTTRTFSSF